MIGYLPMSEIGLGGLASESVLPDCKKQLTALDTLKKNRCITLELSRALSVLEIRAEKFYALDKEGKTAEVLRCSGFIYFQFF
jgi:hypothetical protein